MQGILLTAGLSPPHFFAMETYTDGFVLPIPKARIDDYRLCAEKAAAVWLDHGALDYREWIADDMEAKDIVDIVLQIKAGAFSFEASNPRHEHEWTVWRDAKKADGTILIPGVVTHSSVLVEHPGLVAERILRYVGFAGQDNVIAGTDCGFATFAGSTDIDPAIAWAKLEALVRGAEIATSRLKRARA